MQIEIPQQLRQVLAELEMISHVPAMTMDSSSPGAGEDIGGKRPPGGVDRKDDREPDFPQKSAEHFKRRVAKARSERDMTLILSDAEHALKAWRVQQMPPDPEYGTPQWKKWIAASPLSHGELATRFNVKRSYIQQIRQQYANSSEDGVK